MCDMIDCMFNIEVVEHRNHLNHTDIFPHF